MINPYLQLSGHTLDHFEHDDERELERAVLVRELGLTEELKIDELCVRCDVLETELLCKPLGEVVRDAQARVVPVLQ